MASPCPLTFSSGERPRALWALLLYFYCSCMLDLCFFVAVYVQDDPNNFFISSIHAHMDLTKQV